MNAPAPSQHRRMCLSRGFSAAGGFSLVEIVIALGVASFCLIAMIGLIPTGLKSVKSTTEQTTATQVLDAVAADIRDMQFMNGAYTSPLYGITIGTTVPTTSTQTNYVTESGAPESGANTTSLDARYAVVTSLSNSTTFLTTARIQIYWPVTAQLSTAQGVVETVISFNRQ